MSDGQAWAHEQIADQIEATEPRTLPGTCRADVTVEHVHPCDALIAVADKARTPNWVRGVKQIESIHDGDTLTVTLDMGMGIFHRVKLRLAHVDCPELKTPAGIAARDYTRQWLTERFAGDLTVETVKDAQEKFGRYLAVVRIGAHCLNDDLVSHGHAVPYEGGKRV